MSPYESNVDLERLGESQLIKELRQLYLDRGEPSMRSLAEKTGFSTSTVHAALREDRVPSAGVVRELAEALGGDTERFLKLHELARAGQLGLGDRAAEIAHELKVLPLRTQVVDRRSEAINHVYHGNVYYGVTATSSPAQPPPTVRRPLEESLPPHFREVYESIGNSFGGGLYTAAAALSFWLFEAVVREQAEPSEYAAIETGLEYMVHRDLIEPRLQRWGAAVARRRVEVERFERQGYPQQDAEHVFDFVTALCSSVYLVNRGPGRPL